MSKNIDIKNKKNLELNLKIEKEKTRQLELLKDIKKIEKAIQEKELYTKRNRSICFTDILTKTMEIDYESDCESEYESGSDTDDETDDLKFINSKKHIENDDFDTVSVIDSDSDYDYDREINVVL